MNNYIHTCIYINSYSIHTCTHTFIVYTHIYIHTHMQIQTHIHTHIHTYTHTYTNTYAHTFMHTSKRKSCVTYSALLRGNRYTCILSTSVNSLIARCIHNVLACCSSKTISVALLLHPGLGLALSEKKQWRSFIHILSFLLTFNHNSWPPPMRFDA